MNRQKIFTWLCLFLTCFWATQVWANTPSGLQPEDVSVSPIVAPTSDANLDANLILARENSPLLRAQALNQQGLQELAAGQMEAALETWQAAEAAYAEAGDTAGVFGSSDTNLLNENSLASEFYIHYEHSKAILESMAQTLAAQGTHIVIVNPSRVYGPGILSESNGVTRMIKKYIEGSWRFIPGNGKSVGNYAFIDDVVEGHILAMEKGRSGHRYIIGGENVNYTRFFETLADVSGIKKTLIKLPLPLMILSARIMLFSAKVLNKSPLIIPSLAKKFSKNFPLDTSKAQKELGLTPLPLQKGLEKTVNWLKDDRNEG